MNMYDAIIIGGGAAGLTSAIYLARACYKVLVIEKEKFGGQITITNEVVNYPGIEKTSGSELTENMRRQAQNFGAEFMLAEVVELDLQREMRRVKTNRGEFECFGIVLATGAHPRTIGFKGEKEFKGHGVAYCATCDGEFFAGKDIFVIGGGFVAAEESIFLTKYARNVTILIREEDFTCAKSSADKARENSKITVITNVTVEEVSGKNAPQYIRYRNTVTGQVTEYNSPEKDSFGVFVFAGYEPATELVRGQVNLNAQGYIMTDINQKTNLDGVYAAGDVCVKNLRQVVTATGDGAIAATELERYIQEMQRKTGIRPELTTVKSDEKPKEDVKGKTGIFDGEIVKQLRILFEKMENPIILGLYLDESELSEELLHYMTTLAELTEKITVRIEKKSDAKEYMDNGNLTIEPPCVRVLRVDGSDTGIAFHGVPGGHEFTSFVMAIYNASGKGQTMSDAIKGKIAKIEKPCDIKIMVSLSCTMCPDVVMATQYIAANNRMVNAEAYDINHFGKYREVYNIMSVPCMIINNEKVIFGRKDIGEIVELLK